MFAIVVVLIVLFVASLTALVICSVLQRREIQRHSALIGGALVKGPACAAELMLRVRDIYSVEMDLSFARAALLDLERQRIVVKDHANWYRLSAEAQTAAGIRVAA